MTLLVLGVTHHTAPVTVLDRIALTPTQAQDLAAEAVRSGSVAEAMVISTCNRVEVFAEVSAFHASTADLIDVMAKVTSMPRDELRTHLHVHFGDRAVKHLFAVAAGLDSLVVGEQQIVGQVRSALRSAQESGTAGRQLNAAAQAAIRSAKRIQTETDIDRQGASVVSVGLAAAQEALLRRIDDARILIVGAGSMSGLAVATVAERSAGRLTIVNRTRQRAERLTDSYGGVTRDWAELGDALTEADLVVTCTGSTEVIITEDVLAPRDAGRPLVILDLALPHDSDPGLATVPGVTRIDLSDLADRPETRASSREVANARAILERELTEHLAVEAARRLDPLVVSLRAHAGQVVADEADRLRSRLPGLDERQWAEIDNGMRRIANTLLHRPTVRVKELARDPWGHRYADALHTLFDLPESAIDAIGGELGAVATDHEEGAW